MGARAAVGVANGVNTGDTDNPNLSSYVRGVVCLSYPLYPPGQQNKMRDAPLKDLAYPTLFLSGTKDEFAECSLLEKAVANIPREAKIYWVENANHGHKVPGRKSEEVNEEVFLQMAEWCNYVMGVAAKKSHKGDVSMSLVRDSAKLAMETPTPMGSKDAQATSTEYTYTDYGRDGSQRESPSKASAGKLNTKPTAAGKQGSSEAESEIDGNPKGGKDNKFSHCEEQESSRRRGQRRKPKEIAEVPTKKPRRTSGKRN